MLEHKVRVEELQKTIISKTQKPGSWLLTEAMEALKNFAGKVFYYFLNSFIEVLLKYNKLFFKHGIVHIIITVKVMNISITLQSFLGPFDYPSLSLPSHNQTHGTTEPLTFQSVQINIL